MAFGIYRVGHKLEDINLINTSKNYLDFVIDKYVKNGYPSAFSADWSEIIDTKQSLATMSLVVSVLNSLANASSNYRLLISTLSKKLIKFVDPINGGAYSFLDQQNNPIFFLGKDLKDMALFLMAIAKVNSIVGQEDFRLATQNIIHFIYTKLKNTLLGGYWNHCDKYGKVKVDNIRAYYYRDISPFPIKKISDEALFLYALNNLPNEFYSNIRIIRLDLIDDIGRFHDDSLGGFFVGQSSWFSTPTDPTVPLDRHVMVPQHTVGSFSVGNTNYVPLHQKQALTQCLCYFAFNNLELPIKESQYKRFNYRTQQYKGNLEYISTGSLTHSYISVSKYLEWLKRTESGLGYGLTPYRSPLGFRSDKSPQNFSALHVIADLTVLKKPIDKREDILKGMLACQNDDGGFGEQPSLLSEVFTTYCVVITAFLLKSENGYDKEKCLQFIQSAQKKDGGFGNAPGFPSDCWHTNLAVLALHALGSFPLDKEQAIQFLLSCRNSDGGYSETPGKASDTFATFRAVDSLLILGVKLPEKEKTIEWLQNLQSQEGGFKYQEGKIVSFVGSYHAIAALYLLDKLPIYLEKCKKWIAKHQMEDGGFSRSIFGPSNTTDEGFIALQASYMLERKLNPYWVAILT